MSDLTVVLMLAAVIAAPCVASAAQDPAPLQHKADAYAFEAKQYGAAGKPVTHILAKRYAQLSQSYRKRAASEAYPNR
jgi:hypothetical protein